MAISNVAKGEADAVLARGQQGRGGKSPDIGAYDCEERGARGVPLNYE